VKPFSHRPGTFQNLLAGSTSRTGLPANIGRCFDIKAMPKRSEDHVD
jgi:hypothetical protein